MATEIAVLDVPMQVSPNAAAGIAQYAAVVPDTAGGSGAFDVIYPSGTGQPAIGFSQSVGGPPTPGGTIAPVATSGQSIMVRVLGVTKAIAAGAITAGQPVQVNGTTGQVAALTSLAPAATATTLYAVGFALSSAAAAGDLVSVLLMPGLSTLATS